LPLTTKKVPKAEHQALVEAVARKLPLCHRSLMARSGRLIWIKFVLRAIPIYSMMADSLPPWVRKEIDAICRKFLWVSKDASVRGRCMVAWETCCRPTELGGLGISNLKLVGYALQTRWLWLQKTDNARAWSELPIKADPEVLAFFKASTFTLLGDGNSSLFWEDQWIQGEGISDIAPNLSAKVSRRIKSTLTVRQGLSGRAWIRSIYGGLSIVEAVEYLDLWAATENIILTDSPDRTIWRWTVDGEYTAKSAYCKLQAGGTIFRGHKLIWNSYSY
jgi:hypothetical protein